MKRTFALTLVSVALLVLVTAQSALAQTAVVARDLNPETTRAVWTAEALASARAMPLPRASSRPRPDRPPLEKAAPEAPFKQLFPSGAEGPTLPRAKRAQFSQKLFDFTAEELRALRGAGDLPKPAKPGQKVFGDAGLDYTSSRLIPSSAAEEFPYSPVGKLFFNDSAGNGFVCSASVITKRLVLTAGHCVHDGPAVGPYQDFLFVPAYLNGNAPFGSWAATNVFVLSTWTESGEVPHRHDFALLEMQDQNGQRIADVTGKFGFIANSLADNHLHLLGYPVDFDSGEEMHQNTSGDFINFVENTVVYGSDMTGGASGGPWVQNFNRRAQGQTGGRNRARAAVVGVSSYGFDDDAIRVLGASILTRDFKVLRQQACFNQAGNC